ncbi:MAG: replicative DNA helicase [Ilumatobacteraceae bacterium]
MTDFSRDSGRDRTSRRSDARVPPHNLNAEESLLGALLLSRDVVDLVGELGVTVDHFYKPSHQHIYSAIRGLTATGQPVDVVTVADELRRNGLLDEIGGPQTLLELQNATPAISNASRYAKIVQDTAMLRKLIGVASDIAEIAYLEPDDVTKALDEAETKVFEVAEERVNLTTVRSLSDLLPLAMDKLQETFERGDIITGTATGFHDLDEMLSGLQPSTLNIIGARPAMGKTSLGLGIAAYVAQTARRPVLVFSLEMGHAELTQRILSSEAEVDSQKLRTGRLVEADWTKIGRAINRLDVPMYLDDNPRVTVMEIRAKARRMKARQGLALIVIDYLQLMSGGNNVENRQLEVSEISRGLKILARELEVPIIALSQLSRNLETRGDKRPMLSDLRESGCLTADTRLVRADTNAEVTLGELVRSGGVGVPVWSLDEKYRLVEGTVTAAFSSGVKPVFRLRFASGRTIDASANHPFLTVDGWVRVEDIEIGTHLATGRRLPAATPDNSMADDELILLGHLIGDGCTLARHAVQYTTIDPLNVEAVTAAARFFGVTARVKHEVVEGRGRWTQVYLPSPYRLTRGRHHPISSWLRGLGVWDLRSWEKRIPATVFEQTPEKIALFLRHLWATDGSVASTIYYATSSPELARGVQELLGRLDIRSRLRKVQGPRGRTQYHVEISGRDEQLRFAEVVGIHGSRAARLGERSERNRELRANPNVNIIPKQVWNHIRYKSLAQAGMSARDLAAAIGMSYCGSTLYKSGLSRERLERVAAVTGDEWLSHLAGSDVLWDRVVDVEVLGEMEVFDATVEPHHNFVANGVIAHNSLEQDADVVMFLYRDEVYNKESSDKAMAEVIIAKHRSGPTGTVRLVFRGQYTKFGNAARGV